MSTAPNYRELFNTYHNGFDNYPAWIDHHKAMHVKHPLECEEFGAEWLRRWEGVGRLLQKPCTTQRFCRFRRHWIHWAKTRRGMSVGMALWFAVTSETRQDGLRIVLLDGTIVKEWGVT